MVRLSFQFTLLSLLAQSQSQQELPYEGITLDQVLGNVPSVDDMLPVHLRATATSKILDTTDEYLRRRSPEICDFPLEIVILQDVTESFRDNIQMMRDVELKKMHDALAKSHPGSRYALVSFRDKPIVPFGNASDYCQRFDSNFNTDFSNIYEGYGTLNSIGGYDAPENQFGAMQAAIQSKKIGWTSHGAFARLVVVSTDAGPHFYGDKETTSGMSNPTGKFDEENAATQCVKEFYPKPEQMKKLLETSGTYGAYLVYDGDWANGWAAKSWKLFNAYTGQVDAFVAPQAEDSGDFWEKLGKMIAEIENIECVPVTTTPAPTTTPTTVITTPDTTTATTLTPTTTPTTIPITTKPQVTTGCICEPSGPCGCNEVVIKLRHRPVSMDLVVKNE